MEFENNLNAALVVQPQDQTHISAKPHSEPWYFMYIDLIFVAAVKNISALSLECDGYMPMLYVTMAAFLAIMFSTRLAFDTAMSTFECSDFANILFLLSNIGGMFVMTFFIDIVPNSEFRAEQGIDWNTADIGKAFSGCNQSLMNSQGFLAGFLVTRCSLIVLCAMSLCYGKAKCTYIRDELIFRSLLYGVSFLVVLPGFSKNILMTYWLLAAAIVELVGEALQNTLTNFVTRRGLEYVYGIERRKQFYVLYRNRLAMFFLVILGETVLGLAVLPISTSDASATSNGVEIFVSTFFVTFSLGIQFLTYATGLRSDTTHPLSIVDTMSSLLYVWMHGIASFSLLMVSGAIESFFENSQHSTGAHDDYHYSSFGLHEDLVNRRKIAIGLAITSFCMIILRLLHLLAEANITLASVLAIFFSSIFSCDSCTYFSQLVTFSSFAELANAVVLGLKVQCNKHQNELVRSVVMIGHLFGLLSCIPVVHLTLYHACILCIPAIFEVINYVIQRLFYHNTRELLPSLNEDEFIL